MAKYSSCVTALLSLIETKIDQYASQKTIALIAINSLVGSSLLAFDSVIKARITIPTQQAGKKYLYKKVSDELLCIPTIVCNLSKMSVGVLCSSASTTS